MIDVYVVNNASEGSIDRAVKLLAGIKGGAGKAIGSAIRRTITSTEAFAAKEIRKEYLVSAGDFKRYTHSEKKITSGTDGTTMGITFSGYHIPLIHFASSITSKGRVSVRVKRSSGRQVLDHVFYTGAVSHPGLYERTTPSRLPIEGKMGPSTPQMMSANEEVKEEIGKHIQETFEKRLDHEILAIMNGWR